MCCLSSLVACSTSSAEDKGRRQQVLLSVCVGPQLFLCADLWKSSEVLHAAYCDAEGVTEEFIRNGLSHALSRLPTPYTLDPADWTYKVVVNPDLHQVMAD